MKHIPIKKCGECVCVYKTFDNGVNYRTLKDCFCRHPDRPERPLMKVDPNTIHKDCPLDDLLEWISLKDDQPKEYEWVLAGRSGKNSAVCEARFKKGKFLTSDYNDVDEFIGATHFMIKPEPPE